MKASFKKYTLNFKQPSGTSRGVLHTKDTYFLILSENGKYGVGECALFKGLSVDDKPNYGKKLNWLCNNINQELPYLLDELIEYPSIQFGLEQAVLSLKSKNSFLLFPSNFTKSKASIPINGLIWMGNEEFMNTQIKEKLKAGFTTIKMKIGAIDFSTEIKLLKNIRENFSAQDVALRVDANGAFKYEEALVKLEQLAKLNIHSIEQPIKQGQVDKMAALCSKTPLPIALDEELIGVFTISEKINLLAKINPQFIILKPSLIGGFKGSKEWIKIAENNNIGWWVTSALESNVGLNAIAQWTYALQVEMPQGLGTGGLFTNNFESPLEVKDGQLKYNNNKQWNFNL